MRSLHDALPIADLLPAPAAEDCAVEQEVTEALQTRLRRGFVAPRRLGVRQAVDDGLPNRLGRITRARDVFPRPIDLGDLLLLGLFTLGRLVLLSGVLALSALIGEIGSE